MSLLPSLRPMVLGQFGAPHTLDIFLDYVCPFSAKMTLVLDSTLKPLLAPGGKYDGKVKAIIRLQVQPWHAASTLTHEAALAVIRVSPENFWPYHLTLMKNQTDFFDLPTYELTPKEIRAKLAGLAEPIIGSERAGMVKEMLTPVTTPNGGNAVTNDMKYTIKFARQNGIHVSPTVLWDGIVVNEISSSWTGEQWTDFLSAKVAP